MIYRVTFQDGSTVDTCGDHIWQYHEARGRGKTKVNSTLYLKDRMQKGFRPIVPLTEPVSFAKYQNVALSIKPYTLGVLLGDGSISTSSVSFCTIDDEIKQNVESDGYSLVEWNSNDIRSQVKTYGVHGVQQSLRDINLLGTKSNSKFIPEEYFYSSVENKFSLIQGLMDTDGYVDNAGSTEFCTISAKLAQDMKRMLHSLGFTVTVTEKDTFFTYKGKRNKVKKPTFFIFEVRTKTGFSDLVEKEQNCNKDSR